MVHADDLRASIKVCMFDQYGTVVDMQTGLTEAIAPFLAAKGWPGDPNSFVSWWRRARASIKVCMFDHYGTVVDMQTGLTEAIAPFLAAKGWPGDPNSFVTWWRRTHFEN